MLNSIITASCDDKFDDPFAPFDDVNYNVPTHDDWNGLPWNNEPISDTASATDDDDYDWANFDTDDDQPEALPITKMPDITPEEKEICEVINRKSDNDSDATADNNTSNTDTNGVDIDDDDDMTLFDDNPPPPDDENDIYYCDQSGSQKTTLPHYIRIEKRKDGSEDKSIIRYKLADIIIENDNLIIVHSPASETQLFYIYVNGKYIEKPEIDIKRLIGKYITDADKSLLNSYDVREVMELIRLKAPKIDIDQLNGDENIINFSNGILDINTGKISPHSPDVYTTIQIPCDYVPLMGVDVEKNAPVFCNYISTLCNNDKNVINLLCQFLAVAISNIRGSRLKKAMVLYGDGDTGKSKIIELLQYILGKDNFAVCDIADLEQRFRTSTLFAKRLAGNADMSFAKIAELKVFKSLSGGDQVFAERKGKNGFSFKFDGLFLFASNSLPHFGGDKGDWVYSRFIVLECKNVIPKDKQDKELIDKLKNERKAIIAYLISKLPQIIKSGYKLDIPESCDAALDAFKVQNSLPLQFFQEFCQIRPNRSSTSDGCTRQKIYDAFRSWITTTKPSRRTPERDDFINEVSNFVGINPHTMEFRTSSGRYWMITIKPEFWNKGNIFTD